MPTKVGFTGQYKDDTGLLFYNARYYDPTLGRFLSADSIVPGMASGQGGMAATLGQDTGTALRPLTVDFHELGIVIGVAGENAFTQEAGFWFQLSDQDRRRAKVDSGPGNPQALARYSYVLNNPLRYTDPSGHFVLLVVAAFLTEEVIADIVVAGLIFLTIDYVVTCSQIPSCNYSLSGLANEINQGAISVRSFVAGLGYILQASTGHTPTDGLKEEIDQDTLDAARREAQGEVVKINPRDGEPYDHITKVRQAQSGLRNRIAQINARLGDSRVSQAEKDALARELGEASNLLDYSEQFVP